MTATVARSASVRIVPVLMGLLLTGCGARSVVEVERRDAMRGLESLETRDASLATLARIALLEDGDHERAAVWLSERRSVATGRLAVVEALVAAATGDLKGEIAAWQRLVEDADPQLRRLALLRLIPVADYAPRPTVAIPPLAGRLALVRADLEEALERRRPAAWPVTVGRAAHPVPWSAFYDGAMRTTLDGVTRAPSQVVDGVLPLQNRGRVLARVELTIPASTRGTWLRVGSPEAFEVRVGDERLTARDPTRGPAPERRHLWFEPGAERTVIIDLAVQRAETLLELRMVAGDGPRRDSGRSADDWIAHLIGAELAVLDRDPSGAADSLQALRGLAPGLAATRLLEIRARGPTGKALRKLVGPVSTRTHAALVRTLSVEARSAGREAETDALLSVLRASGDPRSLLEAYRVLRDRGWEAGAHAVLERARKLAPSACEPAREYAVARWTRLKLRQARLERDVFPAGCSRISPYRELVAQFDGEVGRLSSATEALVAEAARRKDPTHGAATRLRLLQRSGRVAQARSLAEQATREDAARDLMAAGFQLGDLLAARREWAGARSAWGDAAGRGVGERELRFRLMALGAGRLWERFTPDVAAIRKEAVPQPLVDGRPALLLVDHHTTLRFRDGLAVHHVYQVMRMLTRSAVEELGEAHLPAGAWVLHAGTRKPDGRLLTPEEIAEKDTISFPELQVGDEIELSYLTWTPPDPGLAGAWLGQPFYFQLADVPTWKASYVMLLQKGVTGRFAASELLAPPSRVRVGEFEGWRWDHKGSPAATLEPLSTSPFDVLPRVQVWSGIDWAGVIRLAREELLRLVAPSRELEALADSLASADVGRSGGIRAIWHWVLREIDESDESFLDVPASVGVARRRGERAVVLLGLLRAAGYDAQLALVDPIHRAHAPWAVPDVRDHSYLVIRVREPGTREHHWLDPTFRGAQFGFLSPTVRDRPAWVVAPQGVVGMKRTPAKSPTSDRRRVHARLTIDAKGGIVGTWTEEARAMDAVSYRDALGSMSEVQRQRGFGEVAQHFLAGVAVTDLRIEGLEATAPVLKIAYRFSRPPGDGALEPLELGLLPLGLSRRWILTASRRQSLYAERNDDLELTVTIDASASAPVRLRPSNAAPVHLDGPFGAYSREITGGGATLQIRKRLRLKPRIVAPSRYQRFRRFCGQVDEADRLTVELTPP